MGSDPTLPLLLGDLDKAHPNGASGAQVLCVCPFPDSAPVMA